MSADPSGRAGQPDSGGSAHAFPPLQLTSTILAWVGLGWRSGSEAARVIGGMERDAADDGVVASLIVPLRVSPLIFEWEVRLSRVLATVPATRFEIIIVDYGTPAQSQPRLDEIIRSAPVAPRLIRAAGPDSPFSIGKARDVGVCEATSPVVLFHDIDFLAPPQTYGAIADEILRREVASRQDSFFCVPVFFLSEAATRAYVRPSPGADLALHHANLRPLAGEAETAITSIAYASSCMVANRHRYLALGGHDSGFSGHGAEDFELMHRVFATAPIAPRPPHYYVDFKDDAGLRYRGFRAAFALYGIELFQRGLFLVHLFHESRPVSGYNQLRRNFHRLRHRMQRFDATGRHPPPLGDHARGRSLVVAPVGCDAAELLREALPLFGGYAVRSSDTFGSPADLLRSAQDIHADRVLVVQDGEASESQASGQLLADAGIDRVVFRRGELPDSWIFDPTGGGPQSPLFRPDAWDRPLSLQERRATLDYLSGVIGETEDPHVGDVTAVRGMLGVAQGDRILLASASFPDPLWASEADKSRQAEAGFDRLLAQLAPLARRAGWHLVVRWGTGRPAAAIEGGSQLPRGFSLGAHLRAADAVLALDPQSGLLAAVAGRPTLAGMDATYVKAGLAQLTPSAEAVLQGLAALAAFDRERALRFVHHLRTQICSFGEVFRPAVRADSRLAGGSGQGMSVAFEELRGIAEAPVFLRRNRTMHALDSPVFAPFGGAPVIERAIRAATLETVADATSLPVRAFRFAGLGLYSLMMAPRLPRRERLILRYAPEVHLADRDTWPARALARLFRPAGPPDD
jgi:predicted glycosyltransferase involved in capsule biosynthesis